MTDTQTRWVSSEHRRSELLEFVVNGGTWDDALREMPVSEPTLVKWRQRFPSWWVQIRAALDASRGTAQLARLDGDRPSFVEFRRRWFGMETPWFQAELVQRLKTAPRGSFTLVLLHPEAGKGGPLSLLMPVPWGSGWCKLGDMKIGDHVFGRDGRAHHITAIHERGVLPMRRVHFSDGTSLDCDPEHLWYVKDRNRGTQRNPKVHWEGVMSTTELEQAKRGPRPRFSVPLCDPIQMPEAQLLIDPWLLGYWLGNGTASGAALSCHSDDAEYVAERVAALGYPVSISEDRSANGSTVRPRDLRVQLRALGVLDHKHIPHAYQWASERQRRELLAGLLDSDGTVSNGPKAAAEVGFKDNDLADATEHLLRSLGIKVGRSERQAWYNVNGERKYTGTFHRLLWTMHECLFSSPRKRAMWTPPKPQGDRARWRYITKIETIDDAEVRCITVDSPDSLYLAGEAFHVTHNTSTIEQWIVEELVHDPTLRFLFATSDKPKSQKRIQQVQRILSPDGPYPEMVNEFGPFKPEQGLGGYQPWTKQYFNVVGKQDSEERDYSVSAAGIEENIQGARCDWLVFDDIQDIKSLNRTGKMMERIRQEWLTRPGPLGRVLGIGTRVGPGDIWEELEESGLVTEVIKYPAILEGYDDWPKPTSKRPECLPPPTCRFLFPERYTPQDYLHMRFTAGEVAWERNYMQKGTDAQSQPFTKAIVMAHADPIRSVNMTPEQFCRNYPDARHLVLSLDPGFGVNAVMLSCLLPGSMVVLDGRLDEGLTSNADIAMVCREMLAKWCIGPLQATHLVIEDKAFQRGLLKDDQMRQIAVDYGCQLVPYTTGREKNDPDVGIPSLVAAFEQGRIVLPAAVDDATDRFINELVRQFERWRPRVSGAVLKQDYVMVCWFTFLRWRKMRAHLDTLGDNPDRSNNYSPFKVAGLPYAPTQIVMPSGFGARR